MDVYIAIMRGGFISSVTIVDSALAEHTIRQYRSAGLVVRVFKDREKYEAFLEHDQQERFESVRAQREVFRIA